jgi:hypothetical protein
MYSQVKTLISPMTPPNYDVERAAFVLLEQRGIAVPSSCLKARRPIRQPGSMGFRAKKQRQSDTARKIKKGTHPQSKTHRKSNQKET